jgi:hypothetical protein
MQEDRAIQRLSEVVKCGLGKKNRKEEKAKRAKKHSSLNTESHNHT